MTRTEVKILEIGLINSCPLKCPMCTRLDDDFKTLEKGERLEFDKIKELINALPALETIDLVGTTSEPTHYPMFIELVKFIKSKDIRVYISTNANTRNEHFWKELGNILDRNDIIKFAVDGSTQEIYEKYRVNGTLQNVLDNHKHFKNENNKSFLQFILFNHNSSDHDDIKELFIRENFDVLEFLPCGEPNPDLKDIRPIKELDIRYTIKNHLIKSTKCNTIQCIAEEDSSLYLNHQGKLCMCCDRDEETFLDNNYPTINNSSIAEMFEHLNTTIEHRETTEPCIINCSKHSHVVYDSYDTVQFDRDLNAHKLKNFREII